MASKLPLDLKFDEVFENSADMQRNRKMDR